METAGSRGDAEARRTERLEQCCEASVRISRLGGGVKVDMNNLDDVTETIIQESLKIHKWLGPGLMEVVYETVLARALERRGLGVQRQLDIRFEYDGMVFEKGFRVDLLVEGTVVVEVKSLEKLAHVHPKQLLTYLRLMRLPVGLLINFGSPLLKQGLHRVVNGLVPSASPRLRVNQPIAVHSPPNPVTRQDTDTVPSA